jgi:hypothetical protein
VAVKAAEEWSMEEVDDELERLAAKAFLGREVRVRHRGDECRVESVTYDLLLVKAPAAVLRDALRVLAGEARLSALETSLARWRGETARYRAVVDMLQYNQDHKRWYLDQETLQDAPAQELLNLLPKGDHDAPPSAPEAEGKG